MKKIKKKKNKLKKELCPAICDYHNCQFKCNDKTLNAEYYDNNRNIYKSINKANLDYSTFNDTLARNEIDFCKSIIKDMYRLEDVYLLNNITKVVKNKYPKDKVDLFDSFLFLKH